MIRDLKSVLDAVLDGVIVLDRDQKIEQLNAEACRLLETSAESTEGRSISEVMGKEHALVRLSQRVLHEGRPIVEDEVPIERRFDHDVALDLAASPLFERSGEISGVVVVARDRTILNSLQARVTDQDLLTSYGHIAAGIAHEVKNPLGGIRGAAELLEMKAQDDRARRTAQLIVRESDRITALVDELMVFARGEQLACEPTNLHRVVDDVLELVSLDPLAEGVETQRIFDPSIPEIDGDPDRLTQVLLNLVRNALQAMEEQEGARVLTIESRMSLENRLTDERGQHVPTVVITVSDNGPGIPEEHLDRLPTPFFTTKVEGTGLGLAVSHHWVTRHGGTLRISSPPGMGTQVHVSLPLYSLIPSSSQPKPSPGSRTSSGADSQEPSRE